MPHCSALAKQKKRNIRKPALILWILSVSGTAEFLRIGSFVSHFASAQAGGWQTAPRPEHPAGRGGAGRSGSAAGMGAALPALPAAGRLCCDCGAPNLRSAATRRSELVPPADQSPRVFHPRRAVRPMGGGAALPFPPPGANQQRAAGRWAGPRNRKQNQNAAARAARGAVTAARRGVTVSSPRHRPTAQRHRPAAQCHCAPRQNLTIPTRSDPTVAQPGAVRRVTVCVRCCGRAAAVPWRCCAAVPLCSGCPTARCCGPNPTPCPPMSNGCCSCPVWPARWRALSPRCGTLSLFPLSAVRAVYPLIEPRRRFGAARGFLGKHRKQRLRAGRGGCFLRCCRQQQSHGGFGAPDVGSALPGAQPGLQTVPQPRSAGLSVQCHSASGGGDHCWAFQNREVLPDEAAGTEVHG